MKPGLGQGQHHFAPAVGEFRKAVQQQHARPIGGLEAGLEQVHPEAVDVVDEVRAYARRQHALVECNHGGHLELCGQGDFTRTGLIPAKKSCSEPIKS